jgi:hypothetical protein
LGNLVFEFGGISGLSFFTLILFLFGLGFLWQKKYRNLFIYLIMFLLFVIVFYFKIGLVYLNFFVVVIAAMGLFSLFSRKWQSNLIKVLAIIILIVGLAFASYSGIVRLINYEPNKNLIDGMQYIKENSDEDVVILSSIENGHLIADIAERKNIMDNNFIYAPNLNKRYKDFNDFIFSKDLNFTKEILDEYNVKFIVIDPNMIGNFWGSEEEGLLHVCRYNKEFEEIFYSGGVEIFEYVG